MTDPLHEAEAIVKQAYDDTVEAAEDRLWIGIEAVYLARERLDESMGKAAAAFRGFAAAWDDWGPIAN